MSEAFIVRRGGGAPYAAIGVGYPEGSVCTCTNGTRTFTARDTSGLALFQIPSIGTWTVTITDGSRSRSAAVPITARGQVESVSLSYALVLFDNGSYAEETGGWSSIKENVLDVSASTTSMNGATGRVYTNDPIDLSGYSILHFILDSTSSSRDQTRRVGVSDTNTGSYSSMVEISNSSTIGEHTLDISTIEESLYIQLYCTAWPKENGVWASTGMAISKIWLE